MGGTAGIGAGHQYANDFVKTFQDPFGKTLSGLVDPINAAAKAGTLTYDQAKAALDTFNQQWTAFDAAAQQFKQQNGSSKKVVDQAYDPKGDFMKTVTGVRKTLEDTLAGLDPKTSTAATNTPAAAPGPDPVGDQQKAQMAARLAAEKLRPGASGFMGTILGGATAKPVLRKPQLMGY